MASCDELRTALMKARDEERFAESEKIELEMIKAGCFASRHEGGSEEGAHTEVELPSGASNAAGRGTAT